MGKLSFNQKRVILIVSGVLVLLCSFFFLFQKNMDTVTELENETRKYQNQINFLSTLQMQINEMKEKTPVYQDEIDKLVAAFPCKVPQQKAYYNIYQMMEKSGVQVTHITAGKPQPFFNSGEFITLSNDDNASESGEASAVSGGAIEIDPESSVPINEMVGKASIYQIELTGTQKQILKAVDWVADNAEQMAVSNLSLAYDSSNGKLSGTATLLFFELNGNGKVYEEPDVSDIMIGTDSIFGAMKK